MIRSILRELVATVLFVWIASVVTFVALDSIGPQDWYGTRESARQWSIPMEPALARDLPRIWNGRIRDARVRTEDDLAALAGRNRDQARLRIASRGTAALPTLMANVRSLRGEVLHEVLGLLQRMVPRVTEGERPPSDEETARRWWERFEALRGVELRPTYSRRLVLRLLDRGSSNAEEQLVRLGTYALPAIFDVLDESIDAEGARSVTRVLRQITGRPEVVLADTSAEQMNDIVRGWRTWWFAYRLEFEALSGARHAVGHIVETRYGRWIERLLNGRLGASAVTSRPLLRELRERVPTSVFVGGLGGLLAVAFVVAFGGGPLLRKRSLNVKLLDLAGALVPGLVAFAFLFVLVCQLAAGTEPFGTMVGTALRDRLRLLPAIVGVGALAVLWLRRKWARVTLHAVRLEAESWARESRHPRLGQIVRHGLRVGLSSLLAPMGLAAAMMLLFSLIVEPTFGIHGMGDLTMRAVFRFDAPWLLLAVVCTVPVLMAQRWARSILVWALGTSRESILDFDAAALTGASNATRANSEDSLEGDAPPATRVDGA